MSNVRVNISLPLLFVRAFICSRNICTLLANSYYLIILFDFFMRNPNPNCLNMRLGFLFIKLPTSC